ncbi:MAG: methylated-DNA--[protein]-cysteine S-methyltransferase [Armatimonadetes bacterium]|nr:methylated-DNA--[protein]-cysteine S-methyltransferase [Armatimonadota bacterium]
MNTSQNPSHPDFTYSFYDTPWGRGLAAADSTNRAVRIYLPAEPEERLFARLVSELATSDVVEGGPVCDAMAEELTRYFNGEKVAFSSPLNLDNLTAFQRRVATATAEIPYGSVDTYGHLAQKAGSPLAFRAVGQVMAKNNLPIVIPCHRVMGHSGGLGGFACGLEWKVRLLELEGYEGLRPALKRKYG